MKNLLLIMLSVVLNLIPFIGKSQEFLNESNQWIYKRLSMSDWSFFKYTWGNATTINDHELKELKVTLIKYVSNPGGSELIRLADTELDSFYIKVDNGLIQYYDASQDVFYPMFLQNPSSGDELVMKHSPLFSCGMEGFPIEETQTVANISSENISNTSVSYYTLENQQYFSVGEKIYNEIGGSMSLFPIPSATCEIVDNNVEMPEKLVCFSGDNMMLSFSQNEIVSCNELLSTKDLINDGSVKNEIKILPNPIKSTFQVVSQEELEPSIEIYARDGKYLGIVNMVQSQVNFDGFARGVYYLQFTLKNSKEVRNVKVLKVDP